MDLGSVSNDVLTEILLRLPAKSLIRFKSVCKKWLSLISSVYFCHQHTLRRPKLQRSLIIQMGFWFQFFFFNQTIKGDNVMIPYTLSVPHHQIVHGCNGLLLLEIDPEQNCHYVYDPNKEELKRDPKHSYYVYNPTTRQSRKITVTNNDKFPFVEAINLAFNPSKSPYYKVVCVKSTIYKPSYSSKSYAYRIEVYDSESHTWKLNLEPSKCPRIYSDTGVHWNNSIFWSPYGVAGGGDGFCCFDIAKNEIKNFAYPPGASYSSKSFLYLQESNGHLYCFQFLKNENESVSVGVWELGGDEHFEWLSKHRDEIHPHFVNDIRLEQIVGVWGGDGATCRLLIYDDSHTTMMAYNFIDNSYEPLLKLTGHQSPKHCRIMKGFQFGETLALV